MKRNDTQLLRGKLLENARQMFIKRGIQTLRMDDLAKKLGISKKTIYVLIKDKASLVKEVIEDYVDQERKINENIRRNASNPVEEMVMLMSHVLQQTKELNPQVLFDLQKFYPESWDIFHHYRSSFMFDFIHTNVKTGVEHNFYRSDLKTDIVAKFYIGAIKVISDQSLFPSKHYPFVSVVKEYLEYHLRAIVTEKGLKELLTLKNKSFHEIHK
ncbi:MAG: TetR/AcrR family transcriptional regulator [Chitinophagales bacterium]|nr:TetR/AcrR family transcriptional regulator [Chitinophagales bacterium]